MANTLPDLEGPQPGPSAPSALEQLRRRLTPEQIRYLAGAAAGLGLGLFIGIRLAKHLGDAQRPSEPQNPPAPAIVRAPCEECSQRERRAHEANLAAEALRDSTPFAGLPVPEEAARSPWDGI